MRLLSKLRVIGISVARSVYSTFPFPEVSHPIFIVGCGRSGTTILGTALSKHKDITYLNEPRNLWSLTYPVTDIWTPKAYSRGGKLFLTESDAENKKNRKLRRLFHLETIINGGPVLIEKLPINNFRLKFIRQIFPDARFIHIYRNGLEVARSIEKKAKEGKWFGANSYKWDKLSKYAMSRDETSNLPGLCENYFDKGLFEWRLSTEAAVEFFRAFPNDRYFELSYYKLVNNPVKTVSQILDFIGINSDRKIERFVLNNIARRTNKLTKSDISEKARMIGGKLLPESMNSEKRLTK